jgi:hypothetical protein
MTGDVDLSIAPPVVTIRPILGDGLTGCRGAHCAILGQAKIKRCSIPFRDLRQKRSTECKVDHDYQETTVVIMVIFPSGKYASAVAPVDTVVDGTQSVAPRRWWAN